mgnify:CR=1 FL=1
MADKNTIPAPNPYDEVPYSSYPFAQTDPARLRSTAYLFGMKDTPVEKARILELGCASGNNILSIASRYPNSECVGIDLSKAQITEGKKRIEELGIKNLKLEQISILDIKPNYGKFDYIICHGVLSWVPDDVQEKILDICKNNLTPNGVAYISYNTMPGWSSVKALREMMLYHTSNFPGASDKAFQARALLQFMHQGSKALNKNFYTDLIENELSVLSNQSDWYLLHDHLEENNKPYYFHEFMDMAANNNLQYLADTELSTMFVGNLPEETMKILNTSNDLVRSEQYMDFITNRRFRCTILCSAEQQLNRNLTVSHIANKYFTSRFHLPDDINDYIYAHGKTINFQAPGNLIFTTSEPEIIAALTILSQQRQKPMHMDDICKAVTELLTSKSIPVKDNLKEFLATHFLRNIFTSGIVMHMDEGLHCKFVSEKPKAFELAVYQSQKQPWITNLLHETLQINDLDRALLPLLNGKNDVNAIAKKLMPLFANNTLSMNIKEEKVTDIDVVSKNLPESIISILARYAEVALLVK